MTTESTFASTVFSGLLAIAASAIVLGFAAAPAEAATIRLSAYELSTEQGRANLDARIQRAARQVCGANSGAMCLSAKRFTDRCIEETIADTRAKFASYRASAQMAAR